MAHLQHSHFPSICAKLEKQKYSPFRVAMKINDNSYVLQLLDNWNISHTFNMADLFEYHLDDEELYEPKLKSSSFSSKRD